VGSFRSAREKSQEERGGKIKREEPFGKGGAALVKNGVRKDQKSSFSSSVTDTETKLKRGYGRMGDPVVGEQMKMRPMEGDGKQRKTQ